MNNQKLAIIGAGSVGKHIAYNIDDYGEYEIVGFYDDDTNKQNKTISGYRVLGKIKDVKELNKDIGIVFGIAFPKVKEKLINNLISEGLNNFPSLVSKHAWISRNVQIGEGVIIYPGVSINFESNIGSFSVINMNVAIGHNCIIGCYSSIAPGCSLAGHTSLGSCVDFGIGAATIQNIIIGENCIIGGQSIVVKEIKKNSLVKGIPAK